MSRLNKLSNNVHVIEYHHNLVAHKLTRSRICPIVLKSVSTLTPFVAFLFPNKAAFTRNLYDGSNDIQDHPQNGSFTLKSYRYVSSAYNWEFDYSRRLKPIAKSKIDSKTFNQVVELLSNIMRTRAYCDIVRFIAQEPDLCIFPLEMKWDIVYDGEEVGKVMIDISRGYVMFNPVKPNHELERVVTTYFRERMSTVGILNPQLRERYWTIKNSVKTDEFAELLRPFFQDRDKLSVIMNESGSDWSLDGFGYQFGKHQNEFIGDLSFKPDVDKNGNCTLRLYYCPEEDIGKSEILESVALFNEKLFGPLLKTSAIKEHECAMEQMTKTLMKVDVSPYYLKRNENSNLWWSVMLAGRCVGKLFVYADGWNNTFHVKIAPTIQYWENKSWPRSGLYRARPFGFLNDDNMTLVPIPFEGVDEELGKSGLEKEKSSLFFEDIDLHLNEGINIRTDEYTPWTEFEEDLALPSETAFAPTKKTNEDMVKEKENQLVHLMENKKQIEIKNHLTRLASSLTQVLKHLRPFKRALKPRVQPILEMVQAYGLTNRSTIEKMKFIVIRDMCCRMATASLRFNPKMQQELEKMQLNLRDDQPPGMLTFHFPPHLLPNELIDEDKPDNQKSIPPVGGLRFSCFEYFPSFRGKFEYYGSTKFKDSGQRIAAQLSTYIRKAWEPFGSPNPFPKSRLGISSVSATSPPVNVCKSTAFLIANGILGSRCFARAIFEKYGVRIKPIPETSCLECKTSAQEVFNLELLFSQKFPTNYFLVSAPATLPWSIKREAAEIARSIQRLLNSFFLLSGNQFNLSARLDGFLRSLLDFTLQQTPPFWNPDANIKRHLLTYKWKNNEKLYELVLVGTLFGKLHIMPGRIVKTDEQEKDDDDNTKERKEKKTQYLDNNTNDSDPNDEPENPLPNFQNAIKNDSAKVYLVDEAMAVIKEMINFS